MNRRHPLKKKNKIYVIPNADKHHNEKWGDKHHTEKNSFNLINFPAPSRIYIVGGVSTGKTNTIKNIMINQSPPPDNVFLIHPETWIDSSEDEEIDPINTEVKNVPEYEGLKAIYLKYIPEKEFFKKFKNQKNILIIDDIELKSYVGKSKKRINRINKLFSYVSSHTPLTIICAFQDPYSQALPCIYRFSDVFILHKMNDKYMNTLLAKNCGVDLFTYNQLLKFCKSTYDNITIDNSNNSPARFRFNILEPINVDDNSTDEESDDFLTDD